MADAWREVVYPAEGGAGGGSGPGQGEWERAPGQGEWEGAPGHGPGHGALARREREANASTCFDPLATGISP